MMTLNDCVDIIEKELSALNLINEPVSLYKPIEYVLEIGGKRVRPAMVLLACSMFNDDVNNALTPALAVEVFHNFTLLHDDIMDNAEVRRGQLTVHKKWDENTAILSGDAMLIKAYELVAKADTSHLSALLNVFNKTALEVCEGQQYDMDFEKRNDVSIDEYLRMIYLKTAVLLAASLKIGAICGNASNQVADELYEFGINIGLAFQLQDDYLDAFSDPKVFGKATGGDILCNKKTCLLIKAFNNAQNEDKVALQNWIDKLDYNPQEKIEAVKDLYVRTGAKEEVRNEIKAYSKKALDILDNIAVGDDKKEALKSFVTKLNDRNK